MAIEHGGPDDFMARIMATDGGRQGGLDRPAPTVSGAAGETGPGGGVFFHPHCTWLGHPAFLET
jgi:hypothetical protein